MASLRSLSTGGNTDSSDEAKERGSTVSITLRELLKTFQTKGRYMSGHFKGRNFRSSSLENLKTKAGYDYGIPGPIHVRRHIPCIFCYADNIVDNVKLTMLCQGRLQSVFCVWVFLDCQKALWNTSFLLLHEDRFYLGKVSMELLLLARHSQWMHLGPEPPRIGLKHADATQSSATVTVQEQMWSPKSDEETRSTILWISRLNSSAPRHDRDKDHTLRKGTLAPLGSLFKCAEPI